MNNSRNVNDLYQNLRVWARRAEVTPIPRTANSEQKLLDDCSKFGLSPESRRTAIYFVCRQALMGNVNQGTRHVLGFVMSKVVWGVSYNGRSIPDDVGRVLRKLLTNSIIGEDCNKYVNDDQIMVAINIIERMLGKRKREVDHPSVVNCVLNQVRG